MRVSETLIVAFAVFAAAMFADSAIAQTDDIDKSWDTDDEAMDEIVVIFSRSGDPVDIETRFEIELRKRVLEEYRELSVLDERYEWQRFDLDIDDTSRIKWGYNAQDDYRLRMVTDLMDLPIDRVKAATVFRFEF